MVLGPSNGAVTYIAMVLGPSNGAHALKELSQSPCTHREQIQCVKRVHSK